MLVGGDLLQAQVERILRSDVFRNSDVLRRLLRFLADKCSAGEADQLKEYTIGIDALGKPATYDPRQDSVVRIQVGRLRAKLAEYYRGEGKDDPVIVDLPKGRFKLSCEPRPPEVATETAAHIPPEVSPPVPATKAIPWRNIAVAAVALLVVALGWGAYTTVQLSRTERFAAPFREIWTPELNELWKPFLTPNRPLVVVVGSPLFVGFQGAGLYRDLSLNRWEDVLKSARIQAMRKALNNPEIVAREYYAGIGEVAAAFQLGKLLTANPVNVSLVRSSQVSWQQLADNNVVFIGAPRLYSDHLRGIPTELDIALEETGIRNLHPQPGEPLALEDHYPSIRALEWSRAPDNGEVFALISHTPGPLGSGDIETFAANHNPGTLAAIQWFTRPNLAKVLVDRLRDAKGEVPRYFQIVLRVDYRDGVPTEVSYVMHHAVHPSQPAANPK